VTLTVPGGQQATTTNPMSTTLGPNRTVNFGIAPTPTNTPTNTPTPTIGVTPTIITTPLTFTVKLPATILKTGDTVSLTFTYDLTQQTYTYSAAVTKTAQTGIYTLFVSSPTMP